MPYRYSRNYETMEDIDREFSRPYGPKTFPGCHLYARLERERAVRQREEYIKELEFRDQMAARDVTLNIDLRNKYEVKAAISYLQSVLESLEEEVFEIPYDPVERGLI